MPDAVGRHPLGYPRLLAVAADKLVDAVPRQPVSKVFEVQGNKQRFITWSVTVRNHPLQQSGGRRSAQAYYLRLSPLTFTQYPQFPPLLVKIF